LKRRQVRTALLTVILLFGALAVFSLVREFAPHSPAPPDDSLAAFRSQMSGIALRGYGMDLLTNNPTAIQTYLARQSAPADFVWPAALQPAAVAGCAVQGWENGKVAMICFRTGRPLPPGQASDLWLFVVDRAALKDPPSNTKPKLTADQQLVSAVWTQGGKVFLLALEGDEKTLRKFL
jgi:hypothetical protein